MHTTIQTNNLRIVNDTRSTPNLGYLQSRGGFSAKGGYRGINFRNGKTPHERTEVSKIEVKKKNVPDDRYQTTSKNPVGRREDVTKNSMINDVVVKEG